MRIYILIENNQNVLSVNKDIDKLLTDCEIIPEYSYLIDVWYINGEFYGTFTISELTDFEWPYIE